MTSQLFENQICPSEFCWNIAKVNFSSAAFPKCEWCEAPCRTTINVTTGIDESLRDCNLFVGKRVYICSPKCELEYAMEAQKEIAKDAKKIITENKSESLGVKMRLSTWLSGYENLYGEKTQ